MAHDDRDANAGQLQCSKLSEGGQPMSTHLDVVEMACIDTESQDQLPVHGSDERQQWSTFQIFATLSLCGLYTGSQLPLYFVAGSLPFIVQSIGGASIRSWLPVSYSLALASLAPFSGYLQDIFGRRHIALIGGTALCVGLILVATSHMMAQAIVGMAISGFGAAIGEMTALAGMSELVPVKNRGWYLGMVAGCVLPFAPYPLYTTLLGTYSTWRWGIWIAVIFNGITLAGISFFYFPNSQLRRQQTTLPQTLAKVDFVGGLLSVGGLTLFLIALSAGGTTNPWVSSTVLCTLIVGSLVIVGFVIWEWKAATFPMVPRELFTGQRIVGMSFVVSFVSGMYFYALLNFLPVIYLNVYKSDPVQAGLKGLSIALGVTAGAVVPNMMLSVWTGRNWEILLACAILTTTFGITLVTCTPENPVQTIALGTIAGFGIGGVVTSAITTAVVASPDDLIATCVALSVSIRTVGGSIATAIYFNIFTAKLEHNLPKYVAKYAVAAGLPTSSVRVFVEIFLGAPQNLTTTTTGTAQVPGLTAAVLEEAQTGSRWAYTTSLKYVWYASLPFGVLACVTCLLLGNTSRFMTKRIAANIRR